MEENGGGRFGFRGGRDEESRDSGWGDEGNRRANGRNNGIGGRGEGGGWGEDRRGGGGGQDDNRRMTGDRDRLDRGGGGRDRDRDRNGRRPQREPEWMNECISKSDVIELRGFDNPAKANNNNKENKEQTNGGGVGKPVNLGNLLPGLNSHNQPGLNRQHEGTSKPHPGLPSGGEFLVCPPFHVTFGT